MSDTAWYSLLRHANRLGPAGAGRNTDATLLYRFAERRDEAAFAELVARHGPMVWGVCRRILTRVPDAEDAFQATFLVLVRKAGSIGSPELLGPWLHGVAQRVAVRLRAAISGRHARERPLGDEPDSEKLPWAERRELRSLLDEEVNRLPERYRVPFVLCHLEGLTNEQAARRIGCPTGTIQSRLARARERLRRRLIRRGVSAGTSGLAAAWSTPADGCPVRSELAAATARAVSRFADGGARSPASAAAVNLAEGVMKAMSLAKLKLAAVVVLALGFLGVGGGMFYRQGLARAEPSTSAPKPEIVPPGRPAGAAGKEPAIDRAAEGPKGRRDLELRDQLRQVVRFNGFDDPKLTLGEALTMLADKFNLQFDVNEVAFKFEGVPNVSKSEIVADQPIPPMNAPLERILRKVLSRVVVNSGAAYLIRKDHIEITTGTFLTAEIGSGPATGISVQDAKGGAALWNKPPALYEEFVDVPLADALRLVARHSEQNIVLDPHYTGKDAPRVTATFHNVRAEVAARVLAAMDDLRVVRLDNVFYVTTPARAEVLRKEWVSTTSDPAEKPNNPEGAKR